MCGEETKKMPNSRLVATAAVLLAVATALAASAEDVLVTYADIVATNKTCGVKDTCALRKTDRKMDVVDWKFRNCFCDANCAAYGDCCVDSRFYVAAEQRRAHKDFSCVALRQFGNVYMRDSCPDGYANAELASKCAAGVNPVEDPFASMPVTSRATTFTYRNFYCAACNDDARTAMLWAPRVECPTLKPDSPGVGDLTPSVVSRDVEFDARAKRWGVRVGSVFHVCHVDPVFPEFVEPLVRKCRHAVSSCPEGYADSAVADRCRSYSAYVYDFETAYRNVHCALCNNVTLGAFYCILNDFSRGRFFEEEFNPLAFAVLLDISPSPSGFESGSVGQVSACGEGQLYDPFFKKCRNVFCTGDGSVWKDGVCTTAASATPKPDGVNVTGNGTESSSFFASCPKFVLSRADFEFADNESTVFVPVYNKSYGAGEFRVVRLGDGSSVAEVCAVGFDTVDKFTPLMGYVSVFCILLSVACLALHLAATVLVPDLQNLSGKNMAALCSALLLAYALFLAGQFRFFKENACAVVGAGMYYFFLASFFWMNCMSFDVWRSLRLATSELRLSSGKQMRKFLAYAAYAWLVPAALLAAAVAVDAAGARAGVPLEFRPGFGVASCWFSNRAALMIFFAGPLGFVMTSNVMFFALSARMIYSTTESSRKIKTSGCNPTRIDLKLYSRLALIMGLTWVVGLVVGYLDRQLEPHSLVFFALWYLFIGLNALQGVFIFATFTCSKKVYDGLADRWRLLCCCCRRRGGGGGPGGRHHRHHAGKDSSFSWSFNNSGSTDTTGSKKRIIESQDSTDSQLSTSVSSVHQQQHVLSPAGP